MNYRTILILIIIIVVFYQIKKYKEAENFGLLEKMRRGLSQTL